MKNPEDLKIFKRLFDFSAWLMNHTNKFPKTHRFSLAVKMENSVLEIIQAVTTANMRKYKLKQLDEADEKLMFLKILFRLSHEMQCINTKSYAYGSRELVEMGKMLGAWIKQQKNAV